MDRRADYDAEFRCPDYQTPTPWADIPSPADGQNLKFVEAERLLAEAMAKSLEKDPATGEWSVADDRYLPLIEAIATAIKRPVDRHLYEEIDRALAYGLKGRQGLQGYVDPWNNIWEGGWALLDAAPYTDREDLYAWIGSCPARLATVDEELGRPYLNIDVRRDGLAKVIQLAMRREMLLVYALLVHAFHERLRNGTTAERVARWEEAYVTGHWEPERLVYRTEPVALAPALAGRLPHEVGVEPFAVEIEGRGEMHFAVENGGHPHRWYVVDADDPDNDRYSVLTWKGGEA